MKRNLPTLFSRSTHSGPPGTGDPPPAPTQGHSLRTCSRLGALGPTGCQGLMVNGLTVMMKAKAWNFCCTGPYGNFHL